MTSQPWIRFWCLSLPLSMSCLQWSHDLSAMDTRVPKKSTQFL
jgi:hypothetical protein